MRVIKCGDTEYQEQCRSCGCQFAFSPNEILTDTTGRFTGIDGFPLRFVICPQCYRDITLNSKILNKI